MFKKFLILCLVAGVCINLTGCFPDGTKTTLDTETENLEELNKTDIENLTFDFNLQTPKESTYPVLTANLKSIDEKQYQKLILGYELNDSVKYIYENETVDDKSINGKDMIYSYIFDDGSENYKIFSTRLGSVYFAAETDKYGADIHSYAWAASYDIQPNPNSMSDIFPNKKLPSFDYEIAVNEMKKILEPLNLPITEPRIYAVDTQSLNNSDAPEEFKKGWSIDNENYTLIYNLEYNGLELSSFSYNTKSTTGLLPQNVQITAAFNEDGLCFLNLRNIPDTPVNDKEINICSGEKAATVVKSQMESIVYSDKTTVFGGELKYISQYDKTKKQLIFFPTWIFYITVEKDNKKSTSCIMINAETAQILQ